VLPVLGTLLVLTAFPIALAAQETPGQLGSGRAPASRASEATKLEDLTDGDIANTPWTAKEEEGTDPAETCRGYKRQTGSHLELISPSRESHEPGFESYVNV
jgi:hypothetical protein